MASSSRKWVCTGALLGFLSVVAGAAGTHWLGTFLDEKYADTFQTAVKFHMVHSVALVVAALVVERHKSGIIHAASLWLFLAGDKDAMSVQLGDLLEGYGQFCDFDYRQLRLIEPLRTLRIIHYAAWIARRWKDPAFPRAFPWFTENKFWEEHVLTLKEQVAAIHDSPLAIVV